jgi:hypothetical protein
MSGRRTLVRNGVAVAQGDGEGRWQSGQLHQTVNLAAYGLRGFESLPAHCDTGDGENLGFSPSKPSFGRGSYGKQGLTSFSRKTNIFMRPASIVRRSAGVAQR